MNERNKTVTHASTTELADLSGLARDFFTKEVAPRHEEFAAAGEPDRALYRRAGDLGLLLMSIRRNSAAVGRLSRTRRCSSGNKPMPVTCPCSWACTRASSRIT